MQTRLDELESRLRRKQQVRMGLRFEQVQY